ncbi:hypothetical protein BKA60DRAFT_548297 [Fusarium oxysporum]|nr:hypothetical protein BKA60DRAFT_548297 [Fusarium oxysporum]
MDMGQPGRPYAPYTGRSVTAWDVIENSVLANASPIIAHHDTALGTIDRCSRRGLLKFLGQSQKLEFRCRNDGHRDVGLLHKSPSSIERLKSPWWCCAAGYQLSPVLQKLDDLGWMRAAALLHDTIRFIEPTTAASASNLVLSWQAGLFSNPARSSSSQLLLCRTVQDCLISSPMIEMPSGQRPHGDVVSVWKLYGACPNPWFARYCPVSSRMRSTKFFTSCAVTNWLVRNLQPPLFSGTGSGDSLTRTSTYGQLDRQLPSVLRQLAIQLSCGSMPTCHSIPPGRTCIHTPLRLSLKRPVRIWLGNALPGHFSLFQLVIVPRLSILKVEAASCSTTQAALAAAPRNFSARLFPAGPIPAHDRSSPPDPIRSALVERENEALSYSIRFDELTTRISMNRESLSQASFVNTIATLATKSSNFHETSVEDGKAFFEQHNDETTLDHTSMIRAMKNYNERMEGCKQEIAQLRLEVTAWEDTRRNDEMRGSAPQRHIEQDMIERQWLVKSLRGIDDNINCSRVIGSLLDIRPSALSCPTKSLAERNICLLIFRITFEALCNGTPRCLLRHILWALRIASTRPVAEITHCGENISTKTPSLGPRVRISEQPRRCSVNNLSQHRYQTSCAAVQKGPGTARPENQLS